MAVDCVEYAKSLSEQKEIKQDLITYKESHGYKVGAEYDRLKNMKKFAKSLAKNVKKLRESGDLTTKSDVLKRADKIIETSDAIARLKTQYAATIRLEDAVKSLIIHFDESANELNENKNMDKCKVSNNHSPDVKK